MSGHVLAMLSGWGYVKNPREKMRWLGNFVTAACSCIQLHFFSSTDNVKRKNAILYIIAVRLYGTISQNEYLPLHKIAIHPMA